MELPIDDVATCFRVNGFMSLGDILTSVDKDYTALIKFVRGNQRFGNADGSNIAKLYRSVLNDLPVRDINGVSVVMLQGTRIVVPAAAQGSLWTHQDLPHRAAAVLLARHAFRHQIIH